MKYDELLIAFTQIITLKTSYTAQGQSTIFAKLWGGEGELVYHTNGLKLGNIIPGK